MMQIFKPLIGRTMEVYIDNIVVKSETRAEHAQHLEEVFCLMQAYNMKLNPAKCAFDVSVGKFLGFMVTQRGIEVNSAQMKVVLETLASNKKKELQRLTSRLVALECFIACSHRHCWCSANQIWVHLASLKADILFPYTKGCTDRWFEHAPPKLKT